MGGDSPPPWSYPEEGQGARVTIKKTNEAPRGAPLVLRVSRGARLNISNLKAVGGIQLENPDPPTRPHPPVSEAPFPP